MALILGIDVYLSMFSAPWVNLIGNGFGGVATSLVLARWEGEENWEVNPEAKLARPA